MKKVLVAIALAAMAMTTAACGKVVTAGNVGIMTKKYGGNAGVQPAPLNVGWHGTGWGEDIIEYPTIQRTYQWTAAGDGDQKGTNEELSFNDKNALPMTADVAITFNIDPAKAPALYQKYKLDFDQLRDGPIRAQVRTAISEETELMAVEDLYSGGRQAVIQRALVRVQNYFRGSGVEVSSLQWIGSIRYPQQITQALLAKTKADADASAARAQVEVAKAQAQSKIEEARGRAEATRLEAEALRSNPEVLRQKEVERWKGLCPLNTKTCIIGGSASQIVQDN
jgi:regulator of protease activity HflC (stomatin/prohibitin superfamily)